MFVAYLLSLAVAIRLVSSSPLKPTPTIEKRAAGVPMIGSGFTAQQTSQLMNAFANANELADYAVTSANMDVFNLYFPPAEFDKAKSVFKKIFDNNAPNPTLSAITISTDFPDSSGDLTCSDGKTLAELRKYDTDNPIMIICPKVAFPHGGIGKGFPNVPAITCSYIGDMVSWKMDTLGATILHEYTHWDKLVIPPLVNPILDQADGYGPYNTQFKLPKAEAINNADSYTWYATQNLWSVLCTGKVFDPPTEDSSNDPNCNNQVCQAPRGNP